MIEFPAVPSLHDLSIHLETIVTHLGRNCVCIPIFCDLFTERCTQTNCFKKNWGRGKKCCSSAPHGDLRFTVKSPAQIQATGNEKVISSGGRPSGYVGQTIEGEEILNYHIGFADIY